MIQSCYTLLALLRTRNVRSGLPACSHARLRVKRGCNVYHIQSHYNFAYDVFVQLHSICNSTNINHGQSCPIFWVLVIKKVGDVRGRSQMTSSKISISPPSLCVIVRHHDSAPSEQKITSLWPDPSSNFHVRKRNS